MLVSTAGINLTNAGYRVNGNLAVNGPTIKIENRATRNSFDSCDRPITVPYHQTIPLDIATRVEYARLCWDTSSRFNPTANPITVAGIVIEPWSWRPLVPGYYQVTADITLEATTPTGTSGWTRLSLAVNGVEQVIGARYQMIADEYTATVSGILLVTPTDNISVSVIQTDSQPIQVAYSSLSASMIRGIE
jgi:hypothetical protein